jgi:MoaA/NifB/PqqE/SkfB family radical SAM enzyme
LFKQFRYTNKRSFAGEIKDAIDIDRYAAKVVKAMRKKIKRFLFTVYGSKGWAKAPTQVTLDLTRACNYRCSWCFWLGVGEMVPHQSKPRGVSAQTLIKNVIDRISCKNYYLTGGEPFLYPELEKLLLYLRKKKKHVFVSTNGTLIDEDWAERIVRQGLVRHVTVSIHGPEEIHDEIAGVKGSFRRAAAGIAFLRRQKEFARVMYPQVSVSCTVEKRNIGHLEELASSVVEWGIASLSFGSTVFTTPEIVQQHMTVSRDRGLEEDFSLSRLVLGPPEHGLSRDEVAAYIEELRCIDSRWGDRLVINRSPGSQGHFADEIERHYFDTQWRYRDKCTYPWRVLRIDPSGMVIPCLGVVMGSIMTQGCDHIWNGKTFRNFRKALYKERLFPGCFRCCKLK